MKARRRPVKKNQSDPLMKLASENKNAIKLFLWFLIVMYPFVNAFLGVDLGDTGIHYYGYEHLFSDPKNLSFTAYFTMALGWACTKIFPALGLLALNLVEVLIEVGLAVISYRLLKPHLGELTTLIGLLISVLAMDTYLNLFNHHQFNVFLIVVIMAFELNAITKDKLRYSFLAGLAFVLVVASRMGSVTVISTFVIYLIWSAQESKKAKRVITHLACAAGGMAAMGACMLVLLKIFGHLGLFVENIKRLAGLASEKGGNGGGGYGFKSLLEKFVKGNLYAIVSGIAFYAGLILLILAFYVLQKNFGQKKGRVFLYFCFCAATAFIAVYLLYYAYHVYDAPAWPQMTAVPSYSIGVLYVSAFIVLIYNMFSSKGKNELIYISLFAFLLPLLTIAGSNTGTKHVILSFWFIAPVGMYVMKQLWTNDYFGKIMRQSSEEYVPKQSTWPVKLAVVIVCFSFVFKFTEMIYKTTNFDSIHRLDLVASIDSDKVRFLRTTQREADAVNGVLYNIRENESYQDRHLMVYGGSILFYTLLDMDSYVQPWFTNGVYANEKLISDIEENESDPDVKLPIIIFCRTNNYYGFYESNYEELIQSQLHSGYSGKRKIFLEFLDRNDYHVGYANDYYCVFYPSGMGTNTHEDYRTYITGET